MTGLTEVDDAGLALRTRDLVEFVVERGDRRVQLGHADIQFFGRLFRIVSHTDSSFADATGRVTTIFGGVGMRRRMLRHLSVYGKIDGLT